ncbi:MAG: MerR family transcriptional regulator [Candidatus Fimadaptatus sp.]
MTIAQVSRRCGVSADTLRYYERMGLLPAIARTPGGIRDYSEDDCSWVDYIKCMRTAGVSVETLAEYVALYRQGDETIAARKQLLLRQRDEIAARIEALTDTLHRLDRKLEGYEHILEFESEHLKR